MSTQYNQIQRPYDELRKTTIAIVERVNVREIVLPFVQGATVLDLACGTGHYSRSFLSWGARSVVAVDISSAMLDEARALSKAHMENRNASGQISFIEADCSRPTIFPGRPFDIVFGGWFLNYAASHAELVEYYRNIFVNLKPGGHYIGVTPPPTEEPAIHYAKECQMRPLPTASGGLYTVVTGEVEDGVIIHLHSDTLSGDLDFDTYHLRKSVWEAAARDAGFVNKIEWTATTIPKDFMENPEKYGEPTSGTAGEVELATYAKVSHYGLLVLKK